MKKFRKMYLTFVATFAMSMSLTIKPLLGTTNQSITITLNSLAGSATAGRQSTVIDNRTNLYADVFVQGKFTIPVGGTAALDKCIYIFVFGTADDADYAAERSIAGTQATIGASDAAYTMADSTVSQTPLIAAAVVPVPVSPTTTDGVYVCAPFSVASLFGGRMPAQWGVVVRNAAGASQPLKSSGNSMWYQGIQDQAA